MTDQNATYAPIFCIPEECDHEREIDGLTFDVCSRCCDCPECGAIRAADLAEQNGSYPLCSEGDHVNDDNPGRPMCKTCEDWHVGEES